MSADDRNVLLATEFKNRRVLLNSVKVSNKKVVKRWPSIYSKAVTEQKM